MAGPAVQGNKVIVGAYTETSYKTLGTPDGMRLSFASFDIKASQPRDVSPVMVSGYRGHRRGVLQQKTIAGTIKTEAGPESIGWLLKHLVGIPTSAVSGGAFKHTFIVGPSPNNLPPGATFEQDLSSALAAPGRYMRYKGCRFAKGAIAFKPGGAIGVSIDVVGADWDASGVAPLDATLTDLGHTSFYNTQQQVVLTSGSAVDMDMKSLTLNWNNNLDEDGYTLNGAGVRGSLTEADVDVSGQFTSLFANELWLNKVLADSDCSLVQTITRGTGAGTVGNEKLVITIPYFAPDIGTPAVAGPKGITYDSAFSAHTPSGELGVKFELYCAQSTIY